MFRSVNGLFDWENGIHPAILRPPFVERRVTHPVLAAQLRHRHTAFGLAQDRKNLGSLYLVIFIKISSCILAEKILLSHPLSFGEDYPREHPRPAGCASRQ
jgi:hypothetical protein